MSIAQLRREIAPLVALYAPPKPWDVASYVEAIGRSRDRPIYLLPTDTKGGVCGLWMPTAQADYIAYERHTSPAHSEHIILHEVGHILCDHPGRPADGPAPHNDWHEQQAEAFATEILLRAGRSTVVSFDPAVDRVLTALDPGDHLAADHPPVRARRRLLHLLWAGH
ncbi:ImmA/IrrE family metallo-endopeptidase [Micromonospora sp. NPDC006766]|uniref:ImmA/IrrE family metallo-endopeptidase n=1 Tax=Micromonospora sp. NPDC006766 TaxID=3154778 RepID=UPI0033E42E16